MIYHLIDKINIILGVHSDDITHELNLKDGKFHLKKINSHMIGGGEVEYKKSDELLKNTLYTDAGVPCLQFVYNDITSSSGTPPPVTPSTGTTTSGTPPPVTIQNEELNKIIGVKKIFYLCNTTKQDEDDDDDNSTSAASSTSQTISLIEPNTYTYTESGSLSQDTTQIKIKIKINPSSSSKDIIEFHPNDNIFIINVNNDYLSEGSLKLTYNGISLTMISCNEEFELGLNTNDFLKKIYNCVIEKLPNITTQNKTIGLFSRSPIQNGINFLHILPKDNEEEKFLKIVNNCINENISTLTDSGIFKDLKDATSIHDKNLARNKIIDKFKKLCSSYDNITNIDSHIKNIITCICENISNIFEKKKAPPQLGMFHKVTGAFTNPNNSSDEQQFIKTISTCIKNEIDKIEQTSPTSSTSSTPETETSIKLFSPRCISISISNKISELETEFGKESVLNMSNIYYLINFSKICNNIYANYYISTEKIDQPSVQTELYIITNYNTKYVYLIFIKINKDDTTFKQLVCFQKKNSTTILSPTNPFNRKKWTKIFSFNPTQNKTELPDINILINSCKLINNSEVIAPILKFPIQKTPSNKLELLDINSLPQCIKLSNIINKNITEINTTDTELYLFKIIYNNNTEFYHIIYITENKYHMDCNDLIQQIKDTTDISNLQTKITEIIKIQTDIYYEFIINNKPPYIVKLNIKKKNNPDPPTNIFISKDQQYMFGENIKWESSSSSNQELKVSINTCGSKSIISSNGVLSSIYNSLPSLPSMSSVTDATPIMPKCINLEIIKRTGFEDLNISDNITLWFNGNYIFVEETNKQNIYVRLDHQTQNDLTYMCVRIEQDIETYNIIINQTITFFYIKDTTVDPVVKPNYFVTETRSDNIIKTIISNYNYSLIGFDGFNIGNDDFNDYGENSLQIKIEEETNKENCEGGTNEINLLHEKEYLKNTNPDCIYQENNSTKPDGFNKTLYGLYNLISTNNKFSIYKSVRQTPIVLVYNVDILNNNFVKIFYFGNNIFNSSTNILIKSNITLNTDCVTGINNNKIINTIYYNNYFLVGYTLSPPTNNSLVFKQFNSNQNILFKFIKDLDRIKTKITKINMISNLTTYLKNYNYNDNVCYKIIFIKDNNNENVSGEKYDNGFINNNFNIKDTSPPSPPSSPSSSSGSAPPSPAPAPTPAPAPAPTPAPEPVVSPIPAPKAPLILPTIKTSDRTTSAKRPKNSSSIVSIGGKNKNIYCGGMTDRITDEFKEGLQDFLYILILEINILKDFWHKINITQLKLLITTELEKTYSHSEAKTEANTVIKKISWFILVLLSNDVDNDKYHGYNIILNHILKNIENATTMEGEQKEINDLDNIQTTITIIYNNKETIFVNQSNLGFIDDINSTTNNNEIDNLIELSYKTTTPDTKINDMLYETDNYININEETIKQNLYNKLLENVNKELDKIEIELNELYVDLPEGVVVIRDGMDRVFKELTQKKNKLINNKGELTELINSLTPAPVPTPAPKAPDEADAADTTTTTTTTSAADAATVETPVAPTPAPKAPDTETSAADTETSPTLELTAEKIKEILTVNNPENIYNLINEIYYKINSEIKNLIKILNSIDDTNITDENIGNYKIIESEIVKLNEYLELLNNHQENNDNVNIYNIILTDIIVFDNLLNIYNFLFKINNLKLLIYLIWNNRSKLNINVDTTIRQDIEKLNETSFPKNFFFNTESVSNKYEYYLYKNGGGICNVDDSTTTCNDCYIISIITAYVLNYKIIPNYVDDKNISIINNLARFIRIKILSLISFNDIFENYVFYNIIIDKSKSKDDNRYKHILGGFKIRFLDLNKYKDSSNTEERKYYVKYNFESRDPLEELSIKYLMLKYKFNDILIEKEHNVDGVTKPTSIINRHTYNDKPYILIFYKPLEHFEFVLVIEKTINIEYYFLPKVLIFYLDYFSSVVISSHSDKAIDYIAINYITSIIHGDINKLQTKLHKIIIDNYNNSYNPISEINTKLDLLCTDTDMTTNIYNYKKIYLNQVTKYLNTNSSTIMCDIIYPTSVEDINKCYELMGGGTESDIELKNQFIFVEGVDVFELAKSPYSNNGIIQVASQYNFLESATVNYSHIFPSTDNYKIDHNYFNDLSQGPAASLSCLSSLILRDYLFKPMDGKGCPSQVIFNFNYTIYENGYFKLYDHSDCYNNYKSYNGDLNIFLENINKLKILFQNSNPVYNDNNLTQVFTAAPSFQEIGVFSNYPPIPNKDSVGFKVCEELMAAQYESIAKLAVLKSILRDDLNNPINLHLTLVGQSSFRNNPKTLDKSFEKIKEILKNKNVRVFFHIFDNINIDAELKNSLVNIINGGKEITYVNDSDFIRGNIKFNYEIPSSSIKLPEKQKLQEKSFLIKKYLKTIDAIPYFNNKKSVKLTYSSSGVFGNFMSKSINIELYEYICILTNNNIDNIKIFKNKTKNNTNTIIYEDNNINKIIITIINKNRINITYNKNNIIYKLEEKLEEKYKIVDLNDYINDLFNTTIINFGKTTINLRSIEYISKLLNRMLEEEPKRNEEPNKIKKHFVPVLSTIYSEGYDSDDSDKEKEITPAPTTAPITPPITPPTTAPITPPTTAVVPAPTPAPAAPEPEEELDKFIKANKCINLIIYYNLVGFKNETKYNFKFTENKTSDNFGNDEQLVKKTIKNYFNKEPSPTIHIYTDITENNFILITYYNSKFYIYILIISHELVIYKEFNTLDMLKEPVLNKEIYENRNDDKRDYREVKLTFRDCIPTSVVSPVSKVSASEALASPPLPGVVFETFFQNNKYINLIIKYSFINNNYNFKLVKTIKFNEYNSEDKYKFLRSILSAKFNIGSPPEFLKEGYNIILYKDTHDNIIFIFYSVDNKTNNEYYNIYIHISSSNLTLFHKFESIDSINSIISESSKFIKYYNYNNPKNYRNVNLTFSNSNIAASGGGNKKIKQNYNNIIHSPQIKKKYTYKYMAKGKVKRKSSKRTRRQRGGVFGASQWTPSLIGSNITQQDTHLQTNGNSFKMSDANSAEAQTYQGGSKGGYIGSVLAQGAAPAGLFAANYMYSPGKKRTKRKHHKKHRKTHRKKFRLY